MQSRAAIAAFRDAAEQRFPDAGWEIRDRSDAAPGIRRFVEQVTMFLTLVGLTALGVGGVGAGQAILAFLDRKRADIAILKSLGADGGLVFLVFFLQVMAMAVLATAAGRRPSARLLPFAAVLVLWRRLAGAAAASGFYPVPLLLARPSACCRPSPLPCRRCAAPAPCRPPACSATPSRPRTRTARISIARFRPAPRWASRR